jgi:hypothetical protein
MAQESYAFGELVVVTHGEGQGRSAVVSQPIRREAPGFILFESETWVSGRAAALDDVRPAGEDVHGFTQLAYHLLKLSSLLIERKVLPLIQS